MKEHSLRGMSCIIFDVFKEVVTQSSAKSIPDRPRGTGSHKGQVPRSRDKFAFDYSSSVVGGPVDDNRDQIYSIHLSNGVVSALSPDTRMVT